MLPPALPGEPHVATLLILGEFHKIKDWAGLGKEYLAKTENSMVYTYLPDLPDQEPVSFWLSAEHLETFSVPLIKVFKAIGFEGSRSEKGSFAWFLLTSRARARDLHRLPMCNAKHSVIAEARRLITAAITDISNYYMSFSKAAIHLAKRRLWVEQAGTCWIQAGFDALDVRIREINSDHRVALRGEAVCQTFSYGNSPPASQYWPPAGGGRGLAPPANPPTPYIGAPWAPTSPPLSGGAPAQAPPAQITQPRIADARFPAGVFHLWGAHAYRHGISMSNGSLMFGTTKCVNPPCMPTPGACLAPWAPNYGPTNRSRWCTTPLLCAKVGLGAHMRPGGHPEESFKFETDCTEIGDPIIAKIPDVGPAAYVPDGHPIAHLASSTRPTGARRGGRKGGRGQAGFRRPPHRGA